MIGVLAILALQHGMTFAAQHASEQREVLSASKILPPDLLSGPNHRVEERVYNDGYLNTYRIGSKFGTFVAVSTPMLRKRIGEINALVRMEQIQNTKEFTSALKEAGTDTLVGFKNLVTEPVDTVKGAASGLGVAFRRAGDALTGPKRSDAEDGKIKDLIGFSKTKREYAYQLGIDAYTDNEKVQDRLDEISWAGYAGGYYLGGRHGRSAGGRRLGDNDLGNSPPVKRGFSHHASSRSAPNEWRKTQGHGRASGSR